MPVTTMPWYLQIFQWASWISTIVYPLAAVGAVVVLFLLWREARRYMTHLVGETATSEETAAGVGEVKELME